jgi:hypothetical protein
MYYRAPRPSRSGEWGEQFSKSLKIFTDPNPRIRVLTVADLDPTYLPAIVYKYKFLNTTLLIQVITKASVGGDQREGI